MSREPLGFWAVPPDWDELSEEEKNAVADVIADKIRAALLAQHAASGRSDTTAEARHGVEGKGDEPQ